MAIGRPGAGRRAGRASARPRSEAKDRKERLSCFARKAVRPGMKVEHAVAQSRPDFGQIRPSRGRAGWRVRGKTLATGAFTLTTPRSRSIQTLARRNLAAVRAIRRWNAPGGHTRRARSATSPAQPDRQSTARSEGSGFRTIRRPHLHRPESWRGEGRCRPPGRRGRRRRPG